MFQPQGYQAGGYQQNYQPQAYQQPQTSASGVFGVAFSAVSAQGKELPDILSAIFNYFAGMDRAPNDLFAQSPQDPAVTALRQTIEQTQDCNQVNSAHYTTVAALLVLYFQLLPHPVVPPKFFSLFLRVASVTPQAARAKQLRVFFGKLPPVPRAVATKLFGFFHRTQLPPDSYLPLFASFFARQQVEYVPAQQPPVEVLNALRQCVEQAFFISLDSDEPYISEQGNQQAPPSFTIKCIADYDFAATDPSMLNLRKGDIITTTNAFKDEWYEGTLNGITGYFPGGYVSVDASAAPPQTIGYAQSQSQGFGSKFGQQQPYQGFGFQQSMQQQQSGSSFGDIPQAKQQNSFGSPMQRNPSPFGSPVQQAGTNSFGAPIQPAPASTFGSPAHQRSAGPFGSSMQQAPSNSFGSPIQPAAPSPFGSPIQPASAIQPASTIQQAVPQQPQMGFGKGQTARGYSGKGDSRSNDQGYPTTQTTSSNEYKVVVAGAGGVGKSALTIMFVQNHFVEGYDPTIEDSYRKQVTVDSRVCFMNILDTAGQEEYSAMRDQYMRTGQGYLLVFSLIDRVTFDQMPLLYDYILQLKDVPKVPTVLAGNKLDLEEEKVVEQTEAEDLAVRLGVPYFATSAKRQLNVEAVFEEVVREIRKSEKPIKKKSSCRIL